MVFKYLFRCIFGDKMIMDITNIRLDEVSVIMSKMERLGLVSRIEKRDDKYLLVLTDKQKEQIRAPTLLDL
jgi:DNA-binding MarR family transcriptional regulator